MALISEVSLACKWPVQAQPSRQSWLLRTCFSENSLRKIVGFFHEESIRTVFSLVYLMYTSLNSGPSPPEKDCGWLYLLKWRKSWNQSHKLSLLWKTVPVLFCLHVLVDVRILQCPSCSYPSEQGSVQTVSEHLLQAKWGCFLDTSVNCAVWHTQLDPHLPLTGFLKGALKCTVFHEHERDVASNYLCAVFILVIR